MQKDKKWKIAQIIILFIVLGFAYYGAHGATIELNCYSEYEFLPEKGCNRQARPFTSLTMHKTAPLYTGHPRGEPYKRGQFLNAPYTTKQKILTALYFGSENHGVNGLKIAARNTAVATMIIRAWIPSPSDKTNGNMQTVVWSFVDFYSVMGRLPDDKKQHMLGSAALMAICEGYYHSKLYCALSALGVGVAKELTDKRFSRGDVTADIAGITGALFYSWDID